MAANNWHCKHGSVWTLIVLLAALQSFVFAPATWADSKTQTISFDSWVEIPGSVLPAGRYVFRLANASSDRHQVLIYDQVSGILVANLATMPQQLEKPVEGAIRFEPRPSPFQGQAVAEWFRPGSLVGEQFIYTAGMPVGEATVAARTAEMEPVNAELTAAPNQPVETDTTAADTTAPMQSAAETTSVSTPDQPPDQPQTQPDMAGVQGPEQTPATVPSSAASDLSGDATNTMPKTASDLPLIAAFGGGALTLAGLLYLFRRSIAKSA